MQKSKVIIIGSGIGGLTAGIYGGRAQLNPLIITGDNVGGITSKLLKIENFPGFPNGIDGKTLIENIKTQAINSNAKIIEDTILNFTIKGNSKILTGKKDTYECEFLIIATGHQKQKSEFMDGEKAFLGLGVSYCSTCDAPFFKGKKIAVTGNSEEIFNEALHLSNFANKIYFITKQNELNNINNKNIPENFLNNSKIEIIQNSKIISINGNKKDGVTSLTINKLNDGNKLEISIDGIFIINKLSNVSKLFKDYLQFDNDGFILTKDNSTKTNIDGVFVIGDARSASKKQAIIAAANGADAIIEIKNLI